MKIGYARVSTEHQNLERQLDILEKEGCEKIFVEKMSGAKRNRPELDKTINYAREGDTIVVVELTRISRSTIDLISIVNDLKERGIHLKSINDNWMDTTSPHGNLIFTIMAGLAEYERELIRQRTNEGLKSARNRGRIGGRPPVDENKIKTAIALYEAGHTTKQILEMTGLKRTTYFDYLRKYKSEKLNINN